MVGTTIPVILVCQCTALARDILADSSRHTDGSGEISSEPRPFKEGEVAEWILLDGVSHYTLVFHAPRDY